MKGVIISGGTGTRLRLITHTGPKQLVPVANQPVLKYAIEELNRAGTTEIGIILGNLGHEEAVRRFSDKEGTPESVKYLRHERENFDPENFATNATPGTRVDGNRHQSPVADFYLRQPYTGIKCDSQYMSRHMWLDD